MSGRYTSKPEDLPSRNIKIARCSEYRRSITIDLMTTGAELTRYITLELGRWHSEQTGSSDAINPFKMPFYALTVVDKSKMCENHQACRGENDGSY